VSPFFFSPHICRVPAIRRAAIYSTSLFSYLRGLPFPESGSFPLRLVGFFPFWQRTPRIFFCFQFRQLFLDVSFLHRPLITRHARTTSSIVSFLPFLACRYPAISFFFSWLVCVSHFFPLSLRALDQAPFPKLPLNLQSSLIPSEGNCPLSRLCPSAPPSLPSWTYLPRVDGLLDSHKGGWLCCLKI